MSCWLMLAYSRQSSGEPKKQRLGWVDCGMKMVALKTLQGHDSFGLLDSVTHFNRAFYLLLEVSPHEAD
jgi:hypothetical protein